MTIENTQTGLEVPSKATGMAARPSFVQQSIEGTEKITKDDIQMPRLALCQAMSPELVEGGPRFIEGLKTGMFFNSLTGQIYGKGPLKFAVVRCDPPRHVEFTEDGKSIVDYNVPANDPRTLFTTDAQGKSKPPIATKFYDYVVMLLDVDRNFELIALSLKSTNIKVAKKLNGLIKTRQAPLYAGAYTLESAMTTAGGHTFAICVIECDAGNPEGLTHEGWIANEPLYKRLKQAYDALKDAKVDIHTEGDGTEFNYGANSTGAPEAEGGM